MAPQKQIPPEKAPGSHCKEADLRPVSQSASGPDQQRSNGLIGRRQDPRAKQARVGQGQLEQPQDGQIQKRPKAHSCDPAWGYETAGQRAGFPAPGDTKAPRDAKGLYARPGSEKKLWLCSLLLLILIVIFSQRSWLSWLLPFKSIQPPQVSITIVRKQIQTGNKTPPELLSGPSQTQNAGQSVATASARLGVPQQADSAAEGLAVESTEQGENLLQRVDRLLRLNNRAATGVAAAALPMRDVRLFFIRVAEESRLQLKSVLHKVVYDQAPLSRTLDQLLKGPSPQEINTGLHSMLPPEMQILSVRIVGESAFLDLSEDFYQVAHLPAVLLAAVKQLVFTATEYPNVKALRILVEGQPIFTESLPEISAKELAKRGLELNAELSREDLWQLQAGSFEF